MICIYANSLVTSSSAYFDRVVQKRAADFFEPVGRIVRHYDYVALRQLPYLAAFDPHTTKLIGCGLLCFDCAAARNERCCTVEHVDDVRIERVNFSLAGLLSATVLYHVVTIRSIEEHCAF